MPTLPEIMDNKYYQYQFLVASFSPYHYTSISSTSYLALLTHTRNFQASSEENAESTPDKDDSSSWEVSYAGIVRPLLSNIFARMGHMKVLPKALAKSADRISTALDLREHYYTAKEYKHVSRISSVYSIILPAFIRSALFGTAVFSSYESLNDYLLRLNIVSNSPTMSLPGVMSSVAGAVAGTVGGLTYYILDIIGHRTKIVHLHSPPHVEIKLFKYAISHSVLFGSYEAIKSFLLNSPIYTNILVALDYVDGDSLEEKEKIKYAPVVDNAKLTTATSSNIEKSTDIEADDNSDSSFIRTVVPMAEKEEEIFYANPHRQHHLLAYTFCSGVAGGLSGIVYELFWLEIEWHRWRAFDWHKPWKWSLRRTWANMKIGMGLAFPSTLAFWAYEFGRE